jgi:pre-mRNA-splicing factor SYF1
MYNIWIARCAEFFGITKTREIYDKAIQNLPDAHMKTMCLKYSDMERKLGEIDRGRAIYTYCSQFCDPRVDSDFWNTWREFEVQHGNEDTFKEMLRIRRSVQAQFSSLNLVNLPAGAKGGQTGATMGLVSGGILGGDAKEDKKEPVKMQFVPAGTKRKEPDSEAPSVMQALEAEKVQADQTEKEEKERKSEEKTTAQLEEMARNAAARAQNPEEISMDDTLAEALIQTQEIPVAVFGDAVKAAKAEAEIEKEGALSRFRKKQKLA